MKGLFITGTDTGVGKTLIAAALLHALTARGLRCAGMKPVAAGSTLRAGVWRNDDADQLAAASGVALPHDIAAPYRLSSACAPHVAARLDGVSIDAARIAACHAEAAARADVLIVEGVGGLRVPLADGFDSADMARQFGLPLILVVGVRLGCINHALLSAEAIAARGLTLAGWVANRIDAAMAHADASIDAIGQAIAAPLLGRVAHLRAPTAGAAARHLDLAMLAIA